MPIKNEILILMLYLSEYLSVPKRFLAYSSNEVEKSINARIDKGCVRIVVNFDGVEYISSSGSHEYLRERDVSSFMLSFFLITFCACTDLYPYPFLKNRN